MLHRYVGPHSTELVAVIAERFGRNPSQITCAQSIDALRGYIINAFISERDEALTLEGTFIGIYVNTSKLARKLRLVQLNEYAFDLNALVEKVPFSSLRATAWQSRILSANKIATSSAAADSSL